MKIVVLDGYALNPGDLSWAPMRDLGELAVFDRTEEVMIVPRAIDAEIVLTNKSLLGAKQIAALPNLKFISVLATGYNIVDIQAAKAKNITVSNVKGYSTDSVAQHSFALLLELANSVGKHAAHVAGGGWSRSHDWSYWQRPLIELAGKNLGILGYGAIGKRVVQLGLAFGMNIIIYHPRLQSLPHPLQLVALDDLFKQSDFLSLHVPLTPDTNEIVNKTRLSIMKPSSFLINTSRGSLINELDLRWALETGHIAGAALDVLATEPPAQEHPLLGLPNCIVTPHQAWASFESRKRLMDESVRNVAAFLEGNPRNLVN